MRVFLLAIVYACFGRLSLLAAIPPGFASPIFASSGIALAALLLYGNHLWAGVWVGSFLMNLWVSFGSQMPPDPWTYVIASFAIASGAAAQAVLGSFFIRKYVGFPNPLADERSVVRFLFLGIGSCVINSLFGVACLYLTGILDGIPFVWSAWTWWVGDALGVLVFAPLLIVCLGYPKESWTGRRAAISIPLTTAFIATALFYIFLNRGEQERLRLEFKEIAQEVSKSIEESLLTYSRATESAQSLVHAFPNPTRREFHTFSRSLLELQPGLHALSWSQVVPDEERLAFEKRTGQPIKERAPNGDLVRAKRRPYYLPVRYIEPYEGNEKVIGFDVGSENVRATAVRKAMATGKAAATPTLELVSPSEKGLLIFEPVFENDKNHLRGVIAAVIHIPDVVEAAAAPLAGAGIRFGLRDDRNLFYGEDIKDPWEVNHFRIADEVFNVRFSPTPAYFQGRVLSETRWLTSAGLILTGLLGAFLLVVTGRRLLIEEALKLSEKRYRTIIETTYDAFIAMDSSGKVTDWNRQAEETFGYTAGETRGRPLSQLVVPARYRRAHAQGIEKFLNTGEGPILNRRIEMPAVHKNGNEFPVELTITSLKTESGYLFTSFVHDITARKKSENELKESEERYRKLFDTAERQVLERTAQLKRANEMLQDSNNDLAKFAYIASHDLREPLRTISNFVGLLCKEYGDRLDGEAKKYIDFAVDASKRMQTRIDDLLDYSKVESSRKAFEAVDCRAILNRVLSDLRLHLEETHSRVDIGDLPTITGDPAQISQLFQNLISNAIKYRSRLAPEIQIRCSQEDGMWLFSVKDNGMGLDMKYADRIFEIFQRLHPIGSSEGTGIGLAICKKIVERHGGRIWVDSLKDRGSTFYFTIPHQPDDRPTQRPPAEMKRPAHVSLH